MNKAKLREYLREKCNQLYSDDIENRPIDVKLFNVYFDILRKLDAGEFD